MSKSNGKNAAIALKYFFYLFWNTFNLAKQASHDRTEKEKIYFYVCHSDSSMHWNQD